MRLVVTAQHDHEGTLRESRVPLVHDFDVGSAVIEPLFNFGALSQNETSTSLAANDTGTYTFTIGSNVLSSGILEARINAGAFTTVIATGNTTGTLAGVTSGDTIEVRHTQASLSAPTQLIVENNASTNVASGVLVA
jgi:hypothetical protein